MKSLLTLTLIWAFCSSFTILNPNGVLPNYSEQLVGSYFENTVNVFKIKDGSRNLGHAIWMNRSSKKIKAKYISSGDVYSKYTDWSRGKNLVMTCSGAFSDNLYKGNGALPVGLNVDNGYIKNRTVLKDKMDGLVIVYATGGIVVSDLDRGDLYLKSLDEKVDIRKDFRAKYQLLKWAETEKATVFQTQLLAYDNELKIDEKGRTSSRERRFLALATDPSGVLYHIIFDIPSSVYLYDGAKNVLEYLKGKSMDVTAILNLDTGAYNVMDFNSTDTRLNGKLEGPTRINKAVNLLSYEFER
jgi:hypothetical protein